MRAKILNLRGSTSTIVHRSVLKDRKYDDEKNEQKLMDGPIRVAGQWDSRARYKTGKKEC